MVSDWVWLSVSMLALLVGAGIGYYQGVKDTESKEDDNA